MKWISESKLATGQTQILRALRHNFNAQDDRFGITKSPKQDVKAVRIGSIPHRTFARFEGYGESILFVKRLDVEFSIKKLITNFEFH